AMSVDGLASWAKDNGLATPAADGAINSGLAGKCLDGLGGPNDNGGPPADGTTVDVADCSDVDGQDWTSWSTGIVTVMGSCMAVSGNGTAAGTPVVLRACDGSPGENWQQVGSTLENPNSGLCLDIMNS